MSYADIREVFTCVTSYEELMDQLNEHLPDEYDDADRILSYWKSNDEVRELWDEVREAVGQEPLTFKS